MTYFIICVSGLLATIAMESAIRKLHKGNLKNLFENLGNFFFYRSFLLYFFPKYNDEEILFSTLVTQNVLLILSVFAFAYAIDFNIALIGLIILLYLLVDYVLRILGNRFPVKTLWVTSFIASLYLFICFPVTYLFIKILKALKLEYMDEKKHEIFEILQNAELSSAHDRKILESIVHFQTRVAREVMVPRMDMFCLNADTSILEAVRRLEDQGYSRVPVYEETIDHIIGVLMYKDILTKYSEYQNNKNDLSILEAPIRSIVKKVMYTPESKKISNLLQDFRKKQVHLAIVVDEYGGTEGIVTIEDILEEIVGEIEDEYDEEEELFTPIGPGSWVVDARMSLIDAKEQLGIELQESNEYDTIGGFIFDKAGTIPSKGFTIQLDNVELEILKSNDRRIEKVKVIKK